MKIMISACLAGENCKYNGGNNRNPGLLHLFAGHTLIPFCPETLGGLPTPRIPAEIVNGTVVNREGVSVDAAFSQGAEKALEIAKREQPDLIVLQSRSPSCGVKQVYDGTFTGTLVPGRGLFAALAEQAGFRVADAEDLMPVTDFPRFSGVFGLYDRTLPVRTGCAGLADRNFNVPNDPAFSYQTASGTKGFTAAAVLTLAAEGKLRLEDSVRSLLENSGEPRKYGSLEWLSETVTVRSLLDHTSGVPDYFDEDVVDDFDTALDGTPNYRYESPEQFFPLTEAVWKKQEVPYASRGSFRYSNGGYVILAAVVEAVSGESFRDYVAGRLFGPSGMGGSGFFRMDEPAPAGVVRASAYQENGRSNIYAVPVIGGGDGGAYTNPRDMARFWNRLDPELNPDSPLAPLIAEAWTPRQEGEDGFYGLGFWISAKNPRIVFLEGFDPGVRFFSYYNRDTKRSLTVCLNDEAADCGEVFERYASMIE